MTPPRSACGASIGTGAPEVLWPPESIQKAVVPLLPGFTMEVLSRIDSTNSELMRRARAGDARPVLLVGEEQTAGRGRLGRSWQSRAGDSLTFSLSLPLAPADWSGLSLAVGVSLAESLHPDIGLKWPNDLWWQERKLGGILVETVVPAASQDASVSPPRQVVIGVGINIATPPDGDYSTAPVGLRELRPGAGAPGVLQRLAAPLVRSVKAFESHGFAPFQARFDARDVLKHRQLILSDGTEGIARGVGNNGALLVHTAAGMAAITSAEVSVRPV